jgi:hypothetical protein
LSEREAILCWASHQFFGDAAASLKNFGAAQDKICRVQPIDGIPNMFLMRRYADGCLVMYKMCSR